MGAADGPGEGVRVTHRIDIGGSASGAVIAGDHNVAIDARHGSTVTLLAPAERPRPTRRGRVELLPRSEREPLGRGAAIAALAAAVAAGGPVQLWGPPGVGKSALLRHAARRLDAGPDGVLFLSAAFRDAGDLAQEIFEACYEAPGYAPTRVELKRLMTGVRVTVYVDDADLTFDQIRELADLAPDAVLVLAGRARTLLGDGTALELGGLDLAAGLALLGRELRRPVDAGERAAAELWQAAAGVPLLLLRAAALVRSDAAGGGALPRPGQVAELCPLLLARLGAAELTALHLLATVDGAGLDPEHIGALAGAPDPAALCARLADLGLALADEYGYRCPPDVVPAVAARFPGPFPADRLCEYLAWWAEQRTTPPARVAAYGRALDWAAGLAEQAGRPDLAVRVTRAASPGLARALRFGAWGRLLGRGWVAARAAGDPRAAAYFTHEAGIRALLIGQRVLFAALIGEALLLWREIGETHGAGAAQHALQYAPQAAHATAAHAATNTMAAHVANLGYPDAAQAAATHGGGAAAHATGTTHGIAAAHSASATTSAAQGAGVAHGASTANAASTGATGASHVGATATAHGATATHGAAATAATGAGGAHAGAAVGTVAATKISVAVAISIAIVAAGGVIGGVLLTATPGAPFETASGIAGAWHDTVGDDITVTEAGPGNYVLENAHGPCGDATADVRGSGDTYSAPTPIFTMTTGSCVATGTMGILTMVVGPDGSTLRITESAPAGVPCGNCDTRTFTRGTSS